MDAVFTFAVGFTVTRPVRPDERTAWVHIAGEDSAPGLAEAQRAAIALVSGHGGWRTPVEMVTSIQLVGAEL